MDVDKVILEKLNTEIDELTSKAKELKKELSKRIKARRSLLGYSQRKKKKENTKNVAEENAQ